MYLGDIKANEILHFMWHSVDANGSSIDRAVDGVISVYKDNDLTQSVAGITDTEAFDGLTGVHAISIDTSADAFYAVASNYSVVLSGATIDGQTINAVLANFSIENRNMRGTDNASTSAQVAALNNLSAADLASAVSPLATSAEIAALNDVAATDIVSAGPITTLAGAVVNVDLVDTCTTNTDMRGTDSAALASNWTATRAGYVDELAAANIPADIDTLKTNIASIEADTQDIQTQVGTAGAGLTDLGGMSTVMKAQINAEADTALSDFFTSPAALVDLFYEEAAAGHLTAGTIGLYLAVAGGILVDTTATGTPTATEIQFTGGVDGVNFYEDQKCWIFAGTGIGQTRPIIASSYSAGTTTLTFDEPFVIPAVATDRILIQADHVHSLTQMKSGVATETKQDATDAVIAELTSQGDTNETALTAIAGYIDTEITALINAVSAIDTTIGTAGAGLTDLGGMSTAMKAQVNAEADTALSDYDPPTNAELSSAVSPLATSAEVAVVDANVDLILEDTGTTIPALIEAVPTAAETLATQLTEDYAADGVAPTLEQAIMLIQQRLGDFDISGDTITIKKLDGTTTAAIYTLSKPSGDVTSRRTS